MVKFRFKKRSRLFSTKDRAFSSSFINTGDLRSKNDTARYRIIYKIILAMLIISTSGYFLFFSGVFKIKDVIIEGNTNISSEDLMSKLSKGSNVFLFDIEKAQSDILKNTPQIRELKIYRGLPNALKIIVVERESKIIWQTNNEKYLISSQGEIAKKLNSDIEIGTMPVVTDKLNRPVELSMKLVPSSFVVFIENIYSQFEGYSGTKPKYFEVEETTFDVNLFTEAGYYVKFNTTRSSRKQLENLKRVIVAKGGEVKEYIDLRIDGWAYFK
ncbi:MAG: FtsQ-type POTRA domain-containing protein [Patescibacteria group bacterium]